MKKVEVMLTTAPGQSRPVGTLAEERGRVFFEYDGSFLATGLDLSPFRLPFREGLFEHADRAFGPLPGMFDDSLPDGWGLLLMDRQFRKLGRDPAAISSLDRLSWLGTRTMGALTYHPPDDREGVDASVFDLHDLARNATDVLAGAAADVLPQLLRAGGSPGGARPKVLVGFDPRSCALVSGEDDLPDGFEPWIVKFPSSADGRDAGPVEFAYARMAAAAGIDMPEVRLFETRQGDRFFGARRFDRGDGNRRFHAHTFGNLIQSNFRVPSADYADLLKATWMLTRDHRDVLRAFRRMVFHVAAHVRDDHVKNFAFLLDDTTGRWTLSPAYDVVYGTGPGGEHTMTLAGEGRDPGRPHILRLARQAGIPERKARSVIDEVLAATARWNAIAAEAGVPASVRKEIRGAFASI
jgi:serine/threonine-protein kinase HipA